MSFADRLFDAIREKGVPACVGLDPRFKQLPEEIKNSVKEDPSGIALGFEAFCKEVINIVKDHVPVVKPQAAFFEALGAPGFVALENVISHANGQGLLVLLDAKRGDIGSTAAAYASAYLGSHGKARNDALTVNPYLGMDTLEPFVNQCQNDSRGIFVLVKTSNPGSGDFQDLNICEKEEGTALFDCVGAAVEKLSQNLLGECGYGSVGAVVGATYPRQLKRLRESMPHTPFLIPGYGAQGGGVEDVLPGFDQNGMGAIVNSSRGIIFAYNNPEFQEADTWQKRIELACLKMKQELAIEKIRQAKSS